jgi:quaternary ammonium compound-resistance protein SugE
MGAAGAAVIGVLMFNEPATALRIGCVGLIVLGIIGLKLTH